MTAEKGRVIPIPLGMVSSYLIKGEKHVLVDAGVCGGENKIIKKIIENGINPKDIELILLTHGHDDHFGGAKVLREITGAKIAIHKNDVENLRNGNNGKLEPTGKISKLLSKLVNSNKGLKDKGLEPDIIIEDKLDLSKLGIKGEVISTPGHTPGSISIVLESKEVIVGDLMMAFINKKKPKYPMWATSISEVNESIGRIMGFSPRIIYAGHGGPFSPEVVLKSFENLKR